MHNQAWKCNFMLNWSWRVWLRQGSQWPYVAITNVSNNTVVEKVVNYHDSSTNIFWIV